MKLNQVIAIEKGIKAKRHSELSELNKLIQKAELFEGFAKHYRKRAEEDTENLPPEVKQVQQTVPAVLRRVKKAVSEYFKVAFQRDVANTSAVADVVVDGVTIIEEAPVTFLLMLEKELVDLRTFTTNLPVLSSSEQWSADANSGLFVSGKNETYRTKKTAKPIVLYDATEHHPAQTQLITEDVVVGFWDNVKQSGAIPRVEQEERLAKLEKLILAVKLAREQANSVEVPPVSVDKLVSYLFE